MTYRERRMAKAERLREWAAKREERAAATFKQGEHYRGDYAFNTQPGHIPERARLIAREDRAHESLAKANAMESKADAIERAADHAIYSDDHDAIAKLEERIAVLEAERERVKLYNASCRKLKADLGDLSILTEADKQALLPALTYQPESCKHGAFPAYHSANLSGNISRQRKRLAELRESSPVAPSSPAQKEA